MADDAGSGLPPVGVVITAFEQGHQVVEAVDSALAQTRAPARVVVVDDGSTDDVSLRALAVLEGRVEVVRQQNSGVAAARNRGVALLDLPYVAVLDGDDRWLPSFLEQAAARIDADPGCIAASSWLRMFGVADHVVRPTGGTLADFLPRNACPASAVVRRSAWQAAGGYRESMRQGFEDWDLFLSALEHGGRVDIVPAALVEYRTHPASLNVTSMRQRLERFGEIVAHHVDAYRDHLAETLLAIESTSIDRLDRWERLLAADPALPVPDPSFGDGGMAAAVRIASTRGRPTSERPGADHPRRASPDSPRERPGRE